MYELTNLLVRLCNIADWGYRMTGSDMSLMLSRRGEKLEKRIANLSYRPESPDVEVVAYLSSSSTVIDLICKGSDAEEVKASESKNPKKIPWNSSHVVSEVNLDYPTTQEAKKSCSEWPKPLLINSLERNILWSVYGETFLLYDKGIPIPIIKDAIEDLIQKNGFDVVKQEVIRKLGHEFWEIHKESLYISPRGKNLGDLGGISTGGLGRVRVRAMSEQESLSSRFSLLFEHLFGVVSENWLSCALVPKKIYDMFPHNDKERLSLYLRKRRILFRWCYVEKQKHAAIVVLAHS